MTSGSEAAREAVLPPLPRGWVYCEFYLCRREIELPYIGFVKKYCSRKCKKAVEYPKEHERTKRARAAKPLICNICGTDKNLLRCKGKRVRLCKPCRTAVVTLTNKAKARRGDFSPERMRKVRKGEKL
jgi:hypothetical protein